MPHAYQMCGFESGSLGQLTNSGTATTIETGIVRSGRYSLRVRRASGSSLAAGSLAQPDNYVVSAGASLSPTVGQDLKAALRVFLYLPSYPSAEVNIVGIGLGGSSEKCSIAMLVNSTGHFRAKITGTSGSLSTAVLPLNKWIEVRLTLLTQNTSGTDTTSGTIVAQGETVTHTKTVTASYTLGQVWFGDFSASSTTFDCYYDDVYFVAAAGNTPSSGDLPLVVFPTATRIFPVSMTGQGASAAWTGSYADALKPLPWDITDISAYQLSSTGGDRTTFTHQASSDVATAPGASVGIAGTIQAVNVLARVETQAYGEVGLRWDGTTYTLINAMDVASWCVGGLSLSTASFDAAEGGAEHVVDLGSGDAALLAVMLEALTFPLYSLIIDGVDRTSFMVFGHIEYTLSASGAGAVRITVLDLSDAASAYRPEIDDTIEFWTGATNLVKGFVTGLTEESGADELDFIGAKMAIEAADQAGLLDLTTIDADVTYAAGYTLKGVLTALVAYVADSGVTLDASQVNGPTLTTDTTFPAGTSILSALNTLQTGTGYLWRMSTAYVLRMRAAGSDSSGYTLTDSGRDVMGRVTTATRRQAYANHLVGQVTVLAYAYAFLTSTTNFADGDTVILGATTYTFQTVLTNVAGHVLIGASEVDSIGNLVAAITLAGGSGTTYAAATTLNASAGAVVQSPGVLKAIATELGASGNSIAVSTTGAAAVWYGEGSIPLSALAHGADLQAVVVEDAVEIAARTAANHLPWRVDLFVNVGTVSYDEAVYLLTGKLRQLVSLPTVVTLTHRKGMCYIGQTISLTFAARNLSGTYMILSVSVRDAEDRALEYTITAVSGSELIPTWLDYFRTRNL